MTSGAASAETSSVWPNARKNKKNGDARISRTAPSRPKPRPLPPPPRSPAHLSKLQRRAGCCRCCRQWTVALAFHAFPSPSLSRLAAAVASAAHPASARRRRRALPVGPPTRAAGARVDGNHAHVLSRRLSDSGLRSRCWEFLGGEPGLGLGLGRLVRSGRMMMG